MAQKPTEPLFLERDNYRRRRVADAARMVPVLGFILLMFPLIWETTAAALIYLFAVWAVLIVLIAFLSRRLSKGVPSEDSDPQRAR